MLKFVKRNKSRVLRCPQCGYEFKYSRRHKLILYDFNCSCGERWAIKVEDRCISYFHLERNKAVKTTA